MSPAAPPARRDPWSSYPYWLLLAGLGLFAALLLAQIAMDPARREGHERGIIQPGREAVVMAFLSPLVHQPPGRLSVAGVRIERSEVHVQFGGAASDAPTPCALPAWAREPGGLAVRYLAGPVRPSPAGSTGVHVTSGDIAVDGCARLPSDTLAATARAVARRFADDPRAVWGPRDGAPPRNRTPGQGAGIFAPLAGLVRLPVPVAAFLALALALAATLIFGERLRRALPPAPVAASREPPSPATRFAALTLLLLGLGLRIHAARAPFEGDEFYSFPTSSPVFTDDHDAWIHPPAHRLAQHAWGRAIHWRRGDPLSSLRRPSFVASALAIALLALGIARARSLAGVLLALLGALPVTVAPMILADALLARSYALAALLVTVTATSLWWREGEDPRAWVTSLMAAGLAVWTDLPAGLAAALVVVVALIACRLPRAWRAAALCVLALWALPLAPGAWEALTTQAYPTHSPDIVRPLDLRPVPVDREGDHTSTPVALGMYALLGRKSEATPVAVLLLALAAAAGSIWLRRRGPLSPGARVALITVALVAVMLLLGSTRLHFRTRNILFMPHLLAAAWVTCAGRAGNGRLPPQGDDGPVSDA